MSRRLALLLVAVLAVPSLAFAAHTTHGPKRQINAADERKAASIVLKRTDFAPGWKKMPSSADDDDLGCPYYRPKGSDLTLTGDAMSDFGAGGGIPFVQSYADVYVSAKDASASWKRTIKLAMARCFGDFFKRKAAADPQVDVGAISYGKLAFARIAPRTAAFRIGLTVTYKQNGASTKVPMALHLVVVGRGRAEVGVATIAPKPGIAAAELRAFAKLLAHRLKVAGF